MQSEPQKYFLPFSAEIATHWTDVYVYAYYTLRSVHGFEFSPLHLVWFSEQMPSDENGSLLFPSRNMYPGWESEPVLSDGYITVLSKIRKEKNAKSCDIWQLLEWTDLLRQGISKQKQHTKQTPPGTWIDV